LQATIAAAQLSSSRERDLALGRTQLMRAQAAECVRVLQVRGSVSVRPH
jgi:hypothetical protein